VYFQGYFNNEIELRMSELNSECPSGHSFMHTFNSFQPSLFSKLNAVFPWPPNYVFLLLCSLSPGPKPQLGWQWGEQDHKNW